MHIPLPSGATWDILEVERKLSLRAQLPGARVFDLAGASLRAAKARGVSAGDRFTLALPASWLVNSPAISRVLRRWALEPHREACLALIELLDAGPEEWGRASADGSTGKDAMSLGLASLGDEPYVVEAVSKILALVVPDAVPLMPPAARAFVLGEGDARKDTTAAFGGIVDWFARAARDHEAALTEAARAHREVEITPAGVLDRLLWFDSEGHKHFASRT